VKDRPDIVTLSLISHTNVGKTTLARTLLRRDVGTVLDQPHVTDSSSAFTMLETPDGASLRLWDTPGFGDSARLLQRLEHSSNPVGWLLSQTWDRFTDRPFFCSQLAARNVRDEADLVLYLVNAAEHPADAAYVPMEMKILSWIGVPVIILLNQTGPPRERSLEQADEQNWRQQLQPHPIVRRILSLDAFARCWIQEDTLLQAVAELLPAGKQATFAKLKNAWAQQKLQVFHQSMALLARQLAQAAADRAPLDNSSLTDRLKRLLLSGDTSAVLSNKERAMALLADRLDQNIRSTTDQLIQLHGLQGQAAAQIFQRLRDHYATNRPFHEGVSALLGGFISGALGGLVADLAAGGMTFGGGALVGGLLGAAGLGGLAKGVNLIRGEATPSVRWSLSFFEGLVRSSLLRYLALAHYGRGRGNYAESEYPKFWQQAVTDTVAARAPQIKAIWEEGKSQPSPDPLAARLDPILTEAATQLLKEFYPEASASL